MSVLSKNYVFQLYIKKLGLAGSYVICLPVLCSPETLYKPV